MPVRVAHSEAREVSRTHVQVAPPSRAHPEPTADQPVTELAPGGGVGASSAMQQIVSAGCGTVETNHANTQGGYL